MTKVKTISLQGKEYAQVKDRLKEFRENCPNGKIETSFQMQGEQVAFKAYVLKDKSDSSSADATGHAIGPNKGLKAFEKLETIAVGRALALLGYSTDGEIASSDEMEEFLSYQESKREIYINDLTERINEAKTLNELKDIWATIDGSYRVELLPIKDAKKKEINENSKVRE